MSNLIIVFTKNYLDGKVKTRLAKDIGDDLAMSVFKDLVAHTRAVCSDQDVADVHVYFDDHIDEEMWPEAEHFVQTEGNLGQRMYNAFKKGFEAGYEKVVGIGTDLDELNPGHLEDAFDILDDADCVFGEAEDGGYYLIGMNELHDFIFENKPWSTSELLDETIEEMELEGLEYELLDVLNDIDTIVDFKQSRLYENYADLLE